VLDLLEGCKPPLLLQGRSADQLQALVLSQGDLEKARWIMFWRRNGQADQEIATWLGVGSVRRLGQLVALLRLPLSVQELVYRYRLTERTLRPLLRFQRLAHFPTLVEWVGLHALSCAQVKAWRERLSPSHDPAEALMHLQAVLAGIDKDSNNLPIQEPNRTQ